MTELAMIWAQAEGGVIGSDGAMPWHIPEDLARFRELTDGSAVVMGRRTWDSLPPRFRPLEGRRNIVVTRQPDWSAEGAEAAHSIDEALGLAGEHAGSTTWIIGGASLYTELLPRADRLEITEVNGRFEGDTLAPPVGEQWLLTSREPEEGWLRSATELEYRFLSYVRRGASAA